MGSKKLQDFFTQYNLANAHPQKPQVKGLNSQNIHHLKHIKLSIQLQYIHMRKINHILLFIKSYYLYTRLNKCIYIT